MMNKWTWTSIALALILLALYVYGPEPSVSIPTTFSFDGVVWWLYLLGAVAIFVLGEVWGGRWLPGLLPGVTAGIALAILASLFPSHVQMVLSGLQNLTLGTAFEDMAMWLSLHPVWSVGIIALLLRLSPHLFGETTKKYRGRVGGIILLLAIAGVVTALLGADPIYLYTSMPVYYHVAVGLIFLAFVVREPWGLTGFLVFVVLAVPVFELTGMIPAMPDPYSRETRYMIAEDGTLIRGIDPKKCADLGGCDKEGHPLTPADDVMVGVARQVEEYTEEKVAYEKPRVVTISNGQSVTIEATNSNEYAPIRVVPRGTYSDLDVPNGQETVVWHIRIGGENTGRIVRWSKDRKCRLGSWMKVLSFKRPSDNAVPTAKITVEAYEISRGGPELPMCPSIS